MKSHILYRVQLSSIELNQACPRRTFSTTTNFKIVFISPVNTKHHMSGTASGASGQPRSKSKRLPEPHHVYIRTENQQQVNLNKVFVVLVNAMNHRPLLGALAGEHLSGKTHHGPRQGPRSPESTEAPELECSLWHSLPSDRRSVPPSHLPTAAPDSRLPEWRVWPHHTCDLEPKCNSLLIQLAGKVAPP